MKNKIDMSQFFEIEITEEELNALRGGQANIEKKEELESESGDGAEYVCCVKIKL